MVRCHTLVNCALAILGSESDLAAMAAMAMYHDRFFVQPDQQEAYALRVFHRFPAPCQAISWRAQIRNLGFRKIGPTCLCQDSWKLLSHQVACGCFLCRFSVWGAFSHFGRSIFANASRLQSKLCGSVTWIWIDRFKDGWWSCFT